MLTVLSRATQKTASMREAVMVKSLTPVGYCGSSVDTTGDSLLFSLTDVFSDFSVEPGIESCNASAARGSPAFILLFVLGPRNERGQRESSQRYRRRKRKCKVRTQNPKTPNSKFSYRQRQECQRVDATTVTRSRLRTLYLQQNRE